MKKKLFLLAVIFAVTISSAQFDIRVHGGMNSVALSNDVVPVASGTDDLKLDGGIGFNFGGSLSFGSKFYVQPGLEYTSIAVKINDNHNNTGTPIVSLVSVPLHVGLRMIDANKENLINLRIFGGMTGSHVLKVSDDGFTYKDAGGVEHEVIHKKEDYKHMILSGDFGMGLDLGPAFIDLGYKMGLSPLFNEKGNNQKANMFYINAGLKFSFF